MERTVLTELVPPSGLVRQVPCTNLAFGTSHNYSSVFDEEARAGITLVPLDGRQTMTKRAVKQGSGAAFSPSREPSAVSVGGPVSPPSVNTLISENDSAICPQSALVL